MSATQSFKPLSMANGCLTSLSTFCPKTSNPFLPFPAKPTNVPRLSCTSFLSCVSLKDKSFSSSKNIITFVARTSGWTEKEEENQVESDEEFVWPNQESDDTEARVSDWEGEAGEGEESVEVGDEESYPEPPEEAKLFVGNLPYDVDSEKLAQIFDQAGVVEVAEVIYNRETDQSRGFGFVTMSTVEEAEKAVEMLNRYDVNGRLLTVNKASPRGVRQERPPRTFEASFRIYVGNLPWQVDDARLEQVFSEYGKVVDARVVSDRETGRSRGFGFVTMSSKTELDDAIAALDGQILDGRAIRVNMAEERPRRGAF